VTTSTRLGLIEDIVISIVVFLVVSLRNTDGTVFQGTNSDKSRLNFVRGESTPQGFNGTVEIVGLTGKFENVKGTCTFDVVRHVLNSTIHLSNHVKCSVSK